MQFVADQATKAKEPPRWLEPDQVLPVQGRVGEDVVVEPKLRWSDVFDELRFELLRGDVPIPSDRYRVQMRGNVVQLTLKQTQKDDTGHYALVATRVGQGFDKGSSKKIHLSIDEPSEEGDPPTFLRRLTDLAVKVGTRTRFLVEIRSSTTPMITWHRNAEPVHAGSRFSFVHEGNFYCVDVAPVTIEDEGHWTCMAENRGGRSSCTSRLTVIVPKAYKRPEFVEELRALLTETGTVSLECKVVGVPTPVLRWFKDDKEIKAGDVFALTANPDDPTSLGIYTCEAVNCMGIAYSSSKVHVVGKGSREGSLKPADSMTPSGPLPIFTKLLQDECCRIGDTLRLSCQVQVPPWPKAITWYNKEGRVEPSEKYHVMEDGLGGYFIEVYPVEAMDEGEWKCVATSAEDMKQFTTCYVAMSIPKNYRKPRFMESLKAVLTEEGLVSFECKVVGFPTPLLRWFKDGQELKPGDVYQLTGTNSLGSYCCIARNCMGEAKSTAELTIEDIQNQLNEEERLQLLSTNQPPTFIKGLRSCEARINEDFRFTIQVSISPEPSLAWYRDDTPVEENEKYQVAKESLGTWHLDVKTLEFVDQAEWKCVASNDHGQSVTSCFLKLIIPKHYKKPKFLESLRAILSEEGAVNLECKVIGVPQPILKWYKDGVELKPGDIHRIISGQDGTCCLGTYTCEATNCMGTVSSSASLLGFEDKFPVRKEAKELQSPNGHELARNLSLSTIHEERTSQLYDTPQTDHSVTLDDRGEVSFSFDGKEVSVSLYETPDLTEEEALQIVEMYADQLSEHVTEHNVIELPPMRFVKESSNSGNLLMEAVVIDVSPDYFVSAEEGDDLRTEADFEDVSIMDDITRVFSSPDQDSRSSLKRSAGYSLDEDEKPPARPPRKKSNSSSKSEKSERSQKMESESFHSAQRDEPLSPVSPMSPVSSLKQDDSDTFADALSSARLSISENQGQKLYEDGRERRRSLSGEKTAGSSIDDGIGGDSSFDSVTGAPKRKKHRKKKHKREKGSSEESSIGSEIDGKRRRSGSASANTEMLQRIESINKTEEPYVEDVADKSSEKKQTISESDRSLSKSSSIDTLQQPFKELTNLVSIALNEPLSSKSEEEKRRIRELTALIQILYDLKATSAFVQTTLSSSSLSELETQFLRLTDSLINVDQATEKILLLTQKELAPALKENVMVSLQILLEPLTSLQRELSSIQDATAQLSTDHLSLLTNSRNVDEAITELMRAIRKTTEMKSMKVVEEMKVIAKEESSDIEETTAKPLEELIEVLMVSQEKVKPEDASPLGSVSPSVESTEFQQKLISDDETKLEGELMKKIVSPIENLREAIAKIEQEKLEETEELPTKKTATVILSTIIHPLEELEQSLNVSLQQQTARTEEIAEETRSNVPSLQSLPVANVFEQLKRSIATIQENVILEASEEIERSEGKALIVKEMEESLENLKFSVGAVQKIVTSESETTVTLSDIEKTSTIETFVRSVKELGEKCMAIVSHPPVKVESPERIQKEELKQVLELMAQPMQLLRETASEIEEQKTEEVQVLDDTSKNVAEALKPLVHPLEELEQLLCTAVQEVDTSKEETAEETRKTALPTEQLKLSPVLEELQRSIVMIEEQIALQPQKSTETVEASVAELIENPLENLKSAVAVIQTVQTEGTRELTGVEETTALRTIAKCVEEIAKVTSVASARQKVEVSVLQQPQIAKIDVQEFGQQALDAITSPIQVLRETVSKIDEQQAQEVEALIVPETKEVANVLHSLVEPLEQLEKSLSVAVQETSTIKEESTSELKDARSSVKLNVEPVLEQLEKSIAVIQEQISLEAGKEESRDKLETSVTKAIEEPLEHLRFSVAAVREIITETEQTSDLSDVDKTSILKSFAKSVEEIGEKCLAVISQQHVGTQLISKELKESQIEILEMAVAPLQVLRETINKLEEEKLQQAEALESSKLTAPENIVLKILVEPLEKLETSLSFAVRQTVSTKLEKTEDLSQAAPSVQQLDIKPVVEELQKCVATIQEQVKLQSTEESIKKKTSLVQATEKSLVDLNSSLAIIQSAVSVESSAEETLSEAEKVTVLRQFARSVQELEECLVSQQEAELEETTVELKVAEKLEARVLEAIIAPVHTLRETIMKIQEESTEEVEALEPGEVNTQTLTPLMHPLEQLERCLMNVVQQASSEKVESVEETKEETPQTIILPILRELKESIVSVEERLTASPEDSTKLEIVRSMSEAIEELKTSAIAVERVVTLSSEETEETKTEKTSVLQAFAKSIEQLEERCLAVMSQRKIEKKLQDVEKQQAKVLDVEVLQKIKPLNTLQRVLQTALEEGKIIEEDTTKELKRNEIPVEKLNLHPVLEELQRSLAVVQQQTSEIASVSAEVDEIRLIKATEESLERMKLSVSAVQEMTISQQDETKELKTGEEKSRLEAFARSIEETGERLLAVVKQHEVKKLEEIPTKKKVVDDFVRSVIEPINELQATILSIDKESELLGKKREQKAVVLLKMIQPLHKLEDSFLSAMQGETVTDYETVKEVSQAIPALQQLPVKSTLEELNKNVVEIQKQLILAKETLSLTGDIEDFSAMRNLERSLSDLRTSVAVVQQLTTIEKPGEQILDVENASALQAFGKAVEEFKKQCSLIVKKPRVIATIVGTIEVSEKILVPTKLLQESISTIEEIKLQEAETLDTSDTRKPVTLLSELIPPLQRLEQSFVAAIQGEHVTEHAAESLDTEDRVSFEKATLTPILEEFQRAIAAIQEHVTMEGDVGSLSEAEEAASQLTTMAQTLTELKTSVAAIQQTTESAAEFAKDLSQTESVAAFETFAKTLRDLVERVATIDHQQVIIEPAADTISEDVSSLKTWADVVEGATVQVTEPMIVDQGITESPSEMVLSISEEETQALKSLARPLNELKVCLAVVVEERKSMDANEVTLTMSEKEDVSLLKTMARPLLELKNVAVSVIQEQTAVESAKEKSFEGEEKPETRLNPLIVPLEELCNSIALIEDHMLVESVDDRSVDEISLLSALAEPLITLHRSISVLEERVMSPEAEAMPEESSNWITECLAVPLEEIERSIAVIRECVVMEPEPGVGEEVRIDTPDWSVVEKLMQPVEAIKLTIVRMEEIIKKDEKAEEESEYDVVKTLVQPLADVQESFLVLRNKTDMSIEEEEASIDAIVDSLSNLEKNISFIEEQAAEKLQRAPSGEGTMIGVLAEPLTQLKEKIMTVEESSTVYLENLEKPLKRLQTALETILISTKLINSIREVNDSIESIDNKIESYKGLLGLEIQIEKEALNTLAKPLEQLKQGIQNLLDRQEIGDEIIVSLRKLRKAIAIVREQSADKPVAEPSHLEITEIFGVSRTLNVCLNELEASTEKVETLWKENLSGEGLVELETPVSNLMKDINLLRDKLLNVQIAWETDEEKKKIKKKKKKTEVFEEEEKTIDTEEEERKKKEEAEKQRQEEEGRRKKEEETLKEMEEKKKNEEAEKLRQQEEERKKKEEVEKLKQEEERKQKEEVERLKQEEEERGKKEEADKLKREEEERKKKEAEKLKQEEEEAEKLKQEEDERKKKEAEKLKQEEEERRKKNEAEKLKQEEEERKKKEAEKLKQEEEERRKKNEAEKLKQEEEERKKKEAEKLKQEEEERRKKEEAEKSKQEEEERKKKEADNLKQEEEERKRKEKEKLKQEEELKKKREEEDRKKKEEQERLKREEEERKKKEEEVILKREEQERKKKEEEEQKKIEEAEKLKQETERKKQEDERLKREEEERKEQEAEKLRLEEEERKKKEAEKIRLEEEERKKQEEEKLRLQEEERKKKEQAEKLKQEEEERKKKEEEEERRKKEEKERKKKEKERLKREEGERKKKEEEERKKKEEAEKLKLEEERKKKEEAENLRQEEERKKKEEAEKLKQEEERKKKEEAENLKHQEERKEKEEAEKLKQEEERKKKEESEKLKQEEERKKKEAEKLRQEEEERKKNEEAEKLKQEEKRKKQEDAEKLKQEEERKKKEEAEKIKQEKERKEKEEAEKLKQDEVRKKKNEAEKLKQEEEKKKKEEAEKLKQEDERKKKEEEERKKKEKNEKLKQEEERKKKEELQKLKEEKERKKKEESEKLKQEDERKKKEEEERKKKEKTEKLKQEEERNKKEEERKRQEAEKLEREAELKKKEEAERLRLEEECKKKEEAEKLKHEEEFERKEAERLKLQEEKRRKEKEAEKLREEEERRKKEEAEKKKQEEEARRKRIEEEQKIESEALKQREEKLRKKKEERRLQQEEDERKEREEAEKRKKEQEQRKREREERAKKEEEERLKREEEERRKKEERAKLKKEEEERRKAEEAERLKRDQEREEQRREEARRRREEQEKQIRDVTEKVRKAEEVRLRKEDETRENRRLERERRRQEEVAKLHKEEEERLEREEERRRKRKEAERQWKEDEEAVRRRETEQDEERRHRRETERQLRREEAAREIKEEEERLRRRHEEETSRLRKRRQEQLRDDTWSKMRQGEADQLFRKITDDALRIEKMKAGFSDVEFWRDRRDKSCRYDSGFDSGLSSTSRSYSWRDSLTSLTRKRIDDFLDYKLRDTSIDRYYHDTGTYYRRRRKRDDHITRARSISLLKYDDYSTGDSDTTITPASVSKPPRYSSRLKTSLRTDFENRGSNLSIYLPSIKDELTPRDKGKKPSFCTRLTNRTVGVGMRTRLTCTVLGHPEPRVYWTRDGERLDVTTNKYKTRFDNGMAYFELHEALPEDSGLYACVAENVHGIATTESTLKVYPDFQPALSPPTFTRSIKDTYRPSDNELILECRVRGHPTPIISWLKDGCILQGDRYKQCYLDDGIYRLEIAAPNSSDSGRYICRAMNDLRTDEISHIVQFNERERKIVRKHEKTFDDYFNIEAYKRPRFSNYLSDYSVPTGGTIALQVEVKGVPAPEVRWFRGERREPVSIPKAKTFTESDVHTLVLPEVTESERGTYICRAINAYGHVDSIATVDVISPSAIDGGKPAMFVSRPSEKSMTVTAGEDVSVSFRFCGVPKPRVTWMKGLRDITDGPRSHKETIDDYVRLTLKRVIPSDEGTYCILLKNRYGCDRSFFSIKVKQRARSLTPEWSSLSNRTETGSYIGLSSESRDDDLPYIKSKTHIFFNSKIDKEKTNSSH
ncbi:Muscle M-line assembly protein unc-89 [Melipona quadrifasciata]|uniref:Muscle M-line assembly protein unc-89 n=1 Tax=Melipona quadrifasciata TaxID=166423 RepID=A0A0N0U4J3_9HYME|nr:Muscle M-line assembly protein unc-89 [Melipona quadrifasciata]